MKNEDNVDGEAEGAPEAEGQHPDHAGWRRDLRGEVRPPAPWGHLRNRRRVGRRHFQGHHLHPIRPPFILPFIFYYATLAFIFASIWPWEAGGGLRYP
eukprot:4465774-Pyramimonas_sp.AAC.1